MLKAKVYPSVDFLYAFLQTRNMLLVEDKPDILHYTGEDKKELLKLLREDKPDLLVLHSKSFFPKLPDNVFWIYHPVKIEKDLYSRKKLLTNSYRLCQHYYQKLGLQAEIVVLPKERKEKHEFNFASRWDRVKQLWCKIKEAMYWE